MTKRRRRFFVILLSLTSIAGGTAGLLYLFRTNLMYFMSPSQVHSAQIPAGQPFRLGGLVVLGSIFHQGGCIDFKVQDDAAQMPVHFCGTVPSLFRVGQGIIAQGALDSTGVFQATRLLAKHDEYYRPPTNQERS